MPPDSDHPPSHPEPPPADAPASPATLAPPDAPGDEAGPPSDPGHGPRPTGALLATAVVATVGVVVALVGLALLARPVSTPVQDCGTAMAFLLDGRTNVVADPANPPAGISAAQARSNNERPCRARVADTARPGAIALAAGTVTAIGALGVEASIRGLDRYRRRRRRRAAPAT